MYSGSINNIFKFICLRIVIKMDQTKMCLAMVLYKLYIKFGLIPQTINYIILFKLNN